MDTFLLVFTGLEPAAISSDFFVDDMPCTIIWYPRLVLCGLEEDLGSEVVFWFDEWFIAFGNHCLVFPYVHVLSPHSY